MVSVSSVNWSHAVLEATEPSWYHRDITWRLGSCSSKAWQKLLSFLVSPFSFRDQEILLVPSAQQLAYGLLYCYPVSVGSGLDWSSHYLHWKGWIRQEDLVVCIWSISLWKVSRAYSPFLCCLKTSNLGLPSATATQCACHRCEKLGRREPVSRPQSCLDWYFKELFVGVVLYNSNCMQSMCVVCSELQCDSDKCCQTHLRFVTCLILINFCSLHHQDICCFQIFFWDLPHPLQ